MQALQQVRALLVAIFVLMGGAGALGSLVALRLAEQDAAPLVIGGVATAYFVGLAVGSMLAFRVIEQVGHIRAFTAFVALFSASALAYSLYTSGPFWALLRAIDGFCIAGVFVCLESWLGDKATAETRGSILAYYMVALYSGQAAGQSLLELSARSPMLPFVVSSMLLSLAILPVALTRRPAPQSLGVSPLGLRRLYTASPLGLTGAMANGVILGAFYGLGAAFAVRAGMSAAETATFLGVVIFGGVLLQWPLGRLSDVVDRRLVIVGVLAAVTVISFGLAVSAGLPATLRLALGALFGGFAFALYPLCAAHTNDHLEPAERVSASAGLVLSYSMGAVVGPLTASAVMNAMGAGALFGFCGAVAGLMLLFAAWRVWARPSIPKDLRTPFQALPRTTPAAVLDPDTAEAAS